MLPDDVEGAELRKEWDNRDKFSEYEYHRIYKLSMVPASFIGLVFVELLHIPDIKVCLLWKNGLILSYTLNTCPCSSYPCEQRAFIQFHSEGGYHIQISVRCCHISHRLLRMISTTIYNLIEDLKLKNSIKRLIPCTHCIRNKFSNIYQYTYEDCIDKAAHGIQFVYCTNIHSSFRRTYLKTLSPDIIFASVPQIKSSQLVVEKLLGKGGFGEVYKATYHNNKDQSIIHVAIKQPYEIIDESSSTPIIDENNNNNSNANNNNLKSSSSLSSMMNKKYDTKLYDEFMKEVQIMRELSHPNIVQLIGIAFRPLRMILEYVENGDLYSLLHDDKSSDISWNLRLLIAWDIAKGLKALQLHSPPVIHRDLHAHNIFISSLSTNVSITRAKIADFGLARGIVRSASFALSDIWLAPEILTGNSYDCKSDVYSYAICCWQIATREIPFSTSNNIPFLRDAIVNENIRPSIELLNQSQAPESFKELIIKSWDSNPQNRPSSIEIVEILQNLLGLKSIPTEYSEKSVPRGSLGSFHKNASLSNSSPNIRDDFSSSSSSSMSCDISLRFMLNLDDILGTSMSITCATKHKKNFWLGTTRGDILTVDIASVSFFFFLKLKIECE